MLFLKRTANIINFYAQTNKKKVYSINHSNSINELDLRILEYLLQQFNKNTIFIATNKF